MPESQPPRRPYYGYTIVAASFCMQGVAVGAMVSYGVFFSYLQGEFGWSRAFISGASSVVMIMMGALGIVFGRINDRIGPRRILLASGVCLAGGYLLMSVLQAGWQLYVFYGVMVGIGLSTHDIVTLSTVARWFRTRRGLMTGLVKAGTGTGQFIIPIVASSLIALSGWRNAYIGIGLVILVVYVLAARLMKRSPAEIGLQPYGQTGDDSTQGDSSGVSFGAALRMPQLWLACLSYFCVIFGAITVLVHIVPHAIDGGMAEGTAAVLVSIIGAVSVAGRITMGTTSDRIGSRKTFMLCFVVLITALIWLQLASAGWMLFAFSVVYGFAHGGFYTVMSPTVAEIFGLQSHGAIFGLIYFFGTLGGAVGPVVAGRLFDVQQTYTTAFWLLLALAVFGLVIMLRVRPVVSSRP